MTSATFVDPPQPGDPPNALSHDRLPTDPRRLRTFATFFKNYMSVSAVIAATAPIPVAGFELIPQFDSLRKLTTTLSSLLAFLALAYIFLNRASLGRTWFGLYLLKGDTGKIRRYPFLFLRKVGLLPVVLILLSLTSLVLYLSVLQSNLRGLSSPQIALQQAYWTEIPNSVALMLGLIGFFVMAEAAFIVMALREYTPDLLGIGDRELIESVSTAAVMSDAIIQNAARLVAGGKAEIQETVGRDLVWIRDTRLQYS
jgi:hypothetical protein